MKLPKLAVSDEVSRLIRDWRNCSTAAQWSESIGEFGRDVETITGHIFVNTKRRGLKKVPLIFV